MLNFLLFHEELLGENQISNIISLLYFKTYAGPISIWRFTKRE
jgi:hypothetical protein